MNYSCFQEQDGERWEGVVGPQVFQLNPADLAFLQSHLLWPWLALFFHPAFVMWGVNMKYEIDMIFRNRQITSLTRGSNWLEVMIFRDR